MKKVNITTVIIMIVGLAMFLTACQNKKPEQNDLPDEYDVEVDGSDEILEEEFTATTTNIQDNVEVVMEQVSFKKEALEKQFLTATDDDRVLIRQRLDFIKANMDTIQARGYYPNPNLSDTDKTEFQKLLNQLAKEIRDL